MTGHAVKVIPHIETPQFPKPHIAWKARSSKPSICTCKYISRRTIQLPSIICSQFLITMAEPEGQQCAGPRTNPCTDLLQHLKVHSISSPCTRDHRKQLQRLRRNNPLPSLGMMKSWSLERIQTDLSPPNSQRTILRPLLLPPSLHPRRSRGRL